MTNRRLLTIGLAAAVLLTAVPLGAAATTEIGREARLSIEQPTFVDTAVEADRSGNTTTYIVDGTEQEIQPQNFNASNVVRFGVEQNTASLTYDPTTTEYKLNVDANGTYTVYWVVAERVEVAGNNTNATTLQKVRYEAQIQVRNANYVHLTEQRHSVLHSAYQNWQEVKKAFEGIGPDIPVAKKLERAIDAYLFLNNPLRALTGDFTAAVIILTMTNGGRLLLGLLFVVPSAAVAPVYIAYRRLKKRLPDIESLDNEKLRIYREKRKKLMVENTPHDVPGIPSRTAEKLQQKFGDNLWEIINTLLPAGGENPVKRAYLQAMAADGVTATYETDAEGNVSDIDFHRDDHVADGGERATWSPDDLNDEFVEAVDWDDIEMHVLTRVDAAEVDTPIHPTGEETDIVEDHGVSIPEDFDSREQLAEAIGHIWQHALTHPYTDDDGYIREERSLLNIFGQLLTVTAEKYDVPVARAHRDMFLWMAEHFDGNEQLQAAAETSGYGDINVGELFDGD